MKNWLTSMAEVSSQTLKKVIGENVGEITMRQGLYTNEITELLLPRSSTLHRVDSSINDINLMLYLFNREAYYYVGTPYKQNFPSESLDTIWAFHVFNYPSVLIPSGDHLFSTLGKDQSILLQKDQDLRQSITCRLKELKHGGHLVFDLLGIPGQESGLRVWDCLDIALRLSVEKDIIQEEDFQKMNLHTQFRYLEEVKDIIHSLPCKLIEINDDEVCMDSYSKYLENKNVGDYVNDLVEFWKFGIWMMLVRALKDKMPVMEIQKCNKEVMEQFKQVCTDVKPPSKQNLFTILIQK